MLDMVISGCNGRMGRVLEEADVVVDFSHPAALTALLAFCVRRGIPAVLATTGYSDEQLVEIEAAATAIPIFRSANFSLGINVLKALARQAAVLLGEDFDIEIVERHHNKKVDAPSGTALLLADAISEASRSMSTTATASAGPGTAGRSALPPSGGAPSPGTTRSSSPAGTRSSSSATPPNPGRSSPPGP